MQITETSSEGLKRQLRIVIGADEIGARFKERMSEIKGNVQLKGFRKGMVPDAHLKKLYGRSMMAETLQQMVDDATRNALSERNLRPAMQPKIDLPTEDGEIEKVLEGKADLAYDMSLEVLPTIAMTDFSALKLTRLVAEIDEAGIDSALSTIAERNTRYEPEEGRTAADGDRVTIDFTGYVDGEKVDNASGEGMAVVLGQSQLIPGFEDGLKGLKLGEEKSLELTFPDEYPVDTMKGKPARFDVKVTEVAKPVKPAIDDEFAKSLGVDDLAKLRELVAAQIKREYEQVSRGKLKRQLLDALDKAHDFELPSSLVDAEFNAVWEQVTRQLESAKRTFADEGKTEEAAREEYRRIAERRVRLGLLIGEIGDKNKIEVTQDELRNALIQQARQFQGQEQKVFEFYQKNPQALAEIRAPIFEDKVVDFILELAKPTEQTVSKDELLKPEADDVGGPGAVGGGA
jgi:trigger factor